MGVPMVRLVGAFFILVSSVFAFAQPRQATAYVDDAQAAMNQAYRLSVFESLGQGNALYDYIHPDSHAITPRAAVVGWFGNEYYNRGPQPATVYGVTFKTWTWDVTGKTYSNTAEVSFQQCFWAENSCINDVVRLVKSDDGEWRWFFGRSRRFLDETIAKYGYDSVPRSQRDFALQDINGFWANTFVSGGLYYQSPSVVPFYGGTYSACDGGDYYSGTAFYCAADETVYFNEADFIAIDYAYGDYASILVLAHEWGHHIQWQLELAGYGGSVARTNPDMELQADCFAGVYTLDASSRGLLEEGDLMEAVYLSAGSGGDYEHGTGDQRTASFLLGFLTGLAGCGIFI